MRYKKKMYTAAVMMFLTLSIVLSVIPMASAAGAITLTPTAQTPGASVSVAGTGFGATKAVGIVCGAEIAVTGEVHNIPSPSGTGPFTAIMNHYPIKPGSFSFHCTVSSDTNVVESDYTDNGDGTLASSSTYALNPFVNYITGAFGRSTSSAWDGYTVVYTASYTYYAYNMTPAAGITTSGAGAFTASVTVPTMANGNYNVTAIDTGGNRATATLGVNVIPEGFTIGIIVLLSTAAVIVGSHCFRKQSKFESDRSIKW
jgi:hypothetical protein